MNEPTANPPRLSSLPESEDSLGVGRMFRGARELPDEELPRLRWRLRTSHRLRAMRPRLVLRVALVVGVAFCTGGVVGAVVSPLLGPKEVKAVVVAPTPASSRRHDIGRRERRARHQARRTCRIPIPDESAPAVRASERRSPDGPQPGRRDRETSERGDIAVTTGSTPSSAAHRATARRATARRFAAVVSSPIAVEQALLGQAIRTLRDGHDARDGARLARAVRGSVPPTGPSPPRPRCCASRPCWPSGDGHEALALLDTVSLASLPNRTSNRSCGANCARHTGAGAKRSRTSTRCSAGARCRPRAPRPGVSKSGPCGDARPPAAGSATKRARAPISSSTCETSPPASSPALRPRC